MGLGVARGRRAIRAGLVVPLIAFGLSLLVGCTAQPSASSSPPASLSQAQAVTEQIETQGFAPPPRTIADIKAILDQQQPDPALVAANRAKADASPPAGLEGEDLAKFYAERGTAAGDLGREAQRLADYRQAYELIDPQKLVALQAYARYANFLAQAESRAGQPRSALAIRLEDVAFFESLVKGGKGGKGKDQNFHRGSLFGEYYSLIQLYVQFGQFDDAAGVLVKSDALLSKLSEKSNQPQSVNLWRARVDGAHGEYLNATGKFTDAEPYIRTTLAENERAIQDAGTTSDAYVASNLDAVQTAQNYFLALLAQNLMRQGRLLEAESAAREALLGSLKLRGRYASETAAPLSLLGSILTEEGRAAEGETLDRVAVDIYRQLGHAPDSTVLNAARATLATTLVAEGHYDQAMSEFDGIRSGLSAEPAEVLTLVDNNLAFTSAAVHVGRAQDAAQAAKAAVDLRLRTLGPKHYDTAEAEGFYGAALAAAGDRQAALAQFQQALPILLSASRGADDSQGSVAGRQRRLRFVLESYMQLLAGSGSLAGDSPDAAEMFRIADAARGQAVQQALSEAAARASVHDAGLSDLVRQEQDALRQIGALNAVLASALSVPDNQQDPASIQQLRGQVDQLRTARATIREEIEQRFPDYVSLIDPRPVTLDETRALLRPGQALIATYVAESRTYVWAFRQQGPVAFSSRPMGAAQIAADVASLRRALDPDASTLGEIPAFDVAGAHALYADLLAPVESGWKGASDLLVVADGSLSELPFALLVTAPATVTPDATGAALFSGYKSVPWLVRQASVTDLPSVASLKALAALGQAPSASRAFIGFGDPWFNPAEAEQAKAEAAAAEVAEASPGGAVTMRGAVKFRSVPRTQDVQQADLSMLPRLPETADEVRAVAKALGADQHGDVYLGDRANEQAVRTMKLDDRRVVMFATHGLVPGDLTNLSEPALALTAPDIAGVPGDGLLTTTKILGLRLDADWVVLSACNTAAGNGAGADSVSGLGLAFIYAGAKAILVSNWPVETTSARTLTTKTFEELSARPGATGPSLSRAQALRAAMLSLIDGPGFVDPSGHTVFSYAHPIFWAPFSLVGDGGG